MRTGLRALLLGSLAAAGPISPIQGADDTLRVVWRTTVGTDVKPQIEAGRVLIHREKIYDLSTGRRLWREGKSHSAPFEVVGAGKRLLCFRGGKMICYQAGGNA